MEFYQLKYLRAIVTKGGVNQAARSLHVSPPAVSKAISNLESELGCLIFDRANRVLTLTEVGKRLLRRAHEMLNLEETTLAEIKGPSSVGEITIAGRDILLSQFGIQMRQVITKLFAESCVNFIETSGAEAISLVDRGNAHLAFTTNLPPASWRKIHLDNIECGLFVGSGHPLARKSEKAEPILMAELLNYDFLSSNSPVWIHNGDVLSTDGWHDDLFPRKISVRAESLYLFRELIRVGKEIAFLPKFWAEANGLQELKVKGGPKIKSFPVYCSSKRARDLSWLGSLMSDFEKSLS